MTVFNTSVLKIGVQEVLAAYCGGQSVYAGSQPVISNLQAWSGLQFNAVSPSRAFTSIPTTGNLIVAVVGVPTEALPITMSDNLGDTGTWQLAQGPIVYSGIETFYVYFKQVETPSGGGKSVTATLGGTISRSAIYISEYSTSEPGTWALDGSPIKSNTSYGTNPTSGYSATTKKSGVIIGGLMSAGSVTAGSGFSSYVSGGTPWFSDKLRVESKIYTDSGNYSADWTGVAQNWSASAVAFSVDVSTPTLNPASFADVVLQVVNESGANNSTSFVDQSTNNWPISAFRGAKWSNLQAPGGSATSLYVDGSMIGTGKGADHSQICIGEGGSPILSMDADNFCLEQVVWINAYPNNTGGEGVPFAFGVAGSSGACLEMALQDVSGYGQGRSVRMRGGSTSPNQWQFPALASGVDAPPQTWMYYKLTRVGNVWKLRSGTLASGTAKLEGASTTMYESRALWDISTMAAGDYAVNIGSDGGSGNKGFVGHIAFTRVTRGGSVIAMDADGIPSLPFQHP